MFTSERLRTIQVVARFCVVGILMSGAIVVVWLANGVSSTGPDQAGFRSSASGDDQRSVTPERPSAPNDAHPAGDVSPSSDSASTTPTPKPSATTPSPAPTATSSSDAPTSSKTRPTHAHGSPPTTPPGKPE